MITGTTEDEHLKNLEEVLQRLENAGLRLKQAKCAFMLPTVEYLKISAAGLQPSEDKVQAIRKAPTPRDVSQLRSFLGAVNYYCKFLPNLSDMLSPLYRLLQQGTKWTWGAEQDKAFEAAKRQLMPASPL